MIGNPYFYAAPIDTTLNAHICKGIPTASYTYQYNDFPDWPTKANLAYAGAMHGRVYNCAYNGNVAFANISWPGVYNFPMTNDFSVVKRFRPVYNDVALDPQATYFAFHGTGMSPASYSFSLHHLNSRLFCMSMFGGIANTGPQNTPFTSEFSAVEDQVYDMVMTFKHLSGYMQACLYIDGVALATNYNIFLDWTRRTEGSVSLISLGTGGINLIHGGTLVEEFALYEGIIDHTVFTGASRTTPIATAGDKYWGISFPATGKVHTSASWNEFGTAKVGTRTDANPLYVINTQSYGDPDDIKDGLYLAPQGDHYEAGYFYGPNGELEGTLITGCDYPAEADVKDGVVYGNGLLTGTFGRHIPLANPYWAPLELQKTLFEILTEDEDLDELLDANRGEKVFDFVPDKTEFPYVTLQALPYEDRANATNDGLRVQFQINVWYQPGKDGKAGRGNKQVQLIQKRINELLQNRKVCIDGWNTLQCRRTFIDIMVEDDNVTRHGVQRFEFLLGSKD